MARILIIDDEDELRFLLRQMLEQAGHEVTEAVNGAEGIELYERDLHELTRAGVRPDVAERVMGHAIQGVEGVYDRHSYRDEKADALKRLAGLIAMILEPPSANVVPIQEAIE